MAPVVDRTEITLSTSSDALNVLLLGRTEQAPTTLLVSRAIVRARVGDRGALQFLYARYADDVYGYVRTIGSGHEEAWEVTQRVFSGLGGLIDRYEEGETSFSIWIRRVAREIVADDIHR